MSELTFIAAFFAGIVSFLSPCILPLIPAFLSYVGGVSVNQAKESSDARTKIFLNTVAFVLGFVIIFSVLGVAISSVFSAFSYDLLNILSKIGGIVIIFFGLFLLKIIKIDFLEREYKLKPMKTRYGYLTSFIFGATFAVSWTPCIGAILGAILTLAATQPASAFGLLLTYAAGLALPFLIVGAFTAQASNLINKYSNVMKYVNIVMGIVLIIIGILVFTGDFVKLANFSHALPFLEDLQAGV